MLKRPRTSDHSVVEMSVVVYNKRPIMSNILTRIYYQTQPVAGGLSEVVFDPVGNTIKITVPPTDTVPPAGPGDWLLDASYIPNPAGTYGEVNGNFYRMVDVTENSIRASDRYRPLPADVTATELQHRLAEGRLIRRYAKCWGGARKIAMISSLAPR